MSSRDPDLPKFGLYKTDKVVQTKMNFLYSYRLEKMLTRSLKDGLFKTWCPVRYDKFRNVFLYIRPPPELLPVLGPLERYMTNTLDAALFCSSRAGSDLGRMSDSISKCLLKFIIFENPSFFIIT